MGTEIEAAAIAAALGAFAGGAPGCDRRCRARARGSGSGRRLGSSGWPRRPAGRQGGRALALRPPLGRGGIADGRRSGALSALRGCRHRCPRDLVCRRVADGQVACLERSSAVAVSGSPAGRPGWTRRGGSAAPVTVRSTGRPMDRGFVAVVRTARSVSMGLTALRAQWAHWVILSRLCVDRRRDRA